MRFLRLIGVCTLALVFAGCLNSTTVIIVKSDGSGTIEQSMTMTAQAAAQLKSMLSGFGQQAGQDKKGGSGLFNEQDMRSASSGMGEGVTFVSSEPIHTAEQEGIRAVYAFTDIRKLHVNEKPSSPGGGGGGMPALGGSGAEDVSFKFAKTPSGTSVVTVVFPEPKLNGSREKSAAKPRDPAAAQALGMVKELFNGLKITLAIQPAGRIVKTNSPFVDGQRVTLFELDFGQLLGDPAMLEKLQDAGSLEEAKVLLKGQKGIKLNLDREVMVEFR
jgi:hypothetical protein